MLAEQFNKEPFHQVPNPKKEYYCSENVSSCGFTYLMKLVFLTINKPHLIDKIKDYKDEINKTNSKGWTALMIACRNSQLVPTKTITELIDLGADLNKQTSIGNNALMLMCLDPKLNLQSFEYLIKHIDVNKQNYAGNNALMILYIVPLQMVRELIKAGLDVNKRNNCELNVLMLFLFYNREFDIQIIHELMKAGLDINAQTSKGWSALMFACYDKNTNVIHELIKTGANVNIMNHEHRTPLLTYISGIFSEKNNDKTIDILIENDYLTFCNKANIKELLNFDCHKITDRLYDMYKCDKNIMVQILPKLTKEEQMDWYKFIVDITRINENIIKHRKLIYEQPNNIISMCVEVNFNRKQNNFYVPDKLKNLFDIKDEKHCMNKISFYL